jgi:hypothetical protein
MVAPADGWSIWIDVEDTGAPAVDDAALSLFGQLFDEYFGVVGGARTHGRYNAKFTLDASVSDAQAALATGITLFRHLGTQAGLVPYPIVWTEVMTFREQDRQLALRSPRLRNLGDA